MEVPPSKFCSLFISVEPLGPTSKISHQRSNHLDGKTTNTLYTIPVLLAKDHTGCVLWKSKLAQIALVGRRIYPQNGHRDNFTREQSWLDTNTFGVPVAIKLSLTSGFVERIASTLHSSFRMPAWELLQWKMARNTYTYTCRLEVVWGWEKKVGDYDKPMIMIRLEIMTNHPYGKNTVTFIFQILLMRGHLYTLVHHNYCFLPSLVAQPALLGGITPISLFLL